MSSDQEAQEDELLALASIYDYNTFSVSEEDGTDHALPEGQFAAQLELPDPFTVEFSRGKQIGDLWQWAAMGGDAPSC